MEDNNVINNLENEEFSNEIPDSNHEEPQQVKPEKKKMKLWVKILLIVLSVAIVGVGIYLFLINFVLFPKFDAYLLYSTLESKFDWDLKYSPKLDQGKANISVDTSESKLKDYYKYNYPYYNDSELKEMVDYTMDMFGTSDLVDLTISANNNKMHMSAEVLDKHFNLYADEDNIALNIEDFDNGNYYGVSIDTLLDDFRNSIFAPNSGSSMALDQETYEMVESIIEELQDFGKESEMPRELEVLVDILTDSFEGSSISDYTTSYSGAKVLGKERDGRTKTYVITKDDVLNFLSSLINRLNSLTEDEEEAVNSILDMISAAAEEKVSIDDIIELLTEAYYELEEVEDDNTEIKVQFVYVYTCLSAITVEVSSSYEGYSETIENQTVIALDFGEKPNIDKDIIFTVVNYTNGEEKSRNEIAYKVKSDGDKTTVVFSVSSETYYYGQKHEYVDSIRIVLDKSKNRITIKGLSEYDSEENENFKVVLGYFDSKTNLRLTLDSIIVEDNEVVIPVDIELNFYQKSSKINIPNYTNVVTLSEDDFLRLGEDLFEYMK